LAFLRHNIYFIDPRVIGAFREIFGFSNARFDHHHHQGDGENENALRPIFFRGSSHFFLSLFSVTLLRLFRWIHRQAQSQRFRKAERERGKALTSLANAATLVMIFFSFASNLSAFSFRFFGIVFSIVFEVNS
jgi:hypothetical protein